MIGDSRPGSLAGAESSGAADLVTAAPTGPIYQLIWGVMHYQLGSREPGQNIAIARTHGQWKGATRQAWEQQREGFRECDGERTNLTVSWMWHIKQGLWGRMIIKERLMALLPTQLLWELPRRMLNQQFGWAITYCIMCFNVLAPSQSDHIFCFWPAFVLKVNMKVLKGSHWEADKVEHWQEQGRGGAGSVISSEILG